MEVQQVAVNTNTINTSMKQHFIGKMYISNGYSDDEIIHFVSWSNGIPVYAKIDSRTAQWYFSSSLLEKMHKGNFIMECDAVIDSNSFLRKIEIYEIFESYNHFNNKLK